MIFSTIIVISPCFIILYIYTYGLLKATYIKMEDKNLGFERDVQTKDLLKKIKKDFFLRKDAMIFNQLPERFII